MPNHSKVSIIIPVYNEEKSLLKNDVYYQNMSQAGELIFVDGGSSDRTAALARKFGRVISAPKSRAIQMNLGAGQASQKILLFLHADTLIHQENLQDIAKAIDDKGYIGGCFQQKLDDPALIYRWIAWVGNVRAKASKVFYGDQAIFVRQDIFKQLGGYPEVKIGEDVLFTKRLRREGKVVVLPFSVSCSIRRWKNQGIMKTFVLNLRIKFALAWNKNLDPLASAYQDVRGK